MQAATMTAMAPGDGPKEPAPDTVPAEEKADEAPRQVYAQAAVDPCAKESFGAAAGNACTSGGPAMPAPSGCTVYASRCTSEGAVSPRDGGFPGWGYDADARPLYPLLRASPPMPVGRSPGRFRIVVERNCLSQPFGISVTRARSSGAAIIAGDLSHLGLRKGDTVVGLNGRSVTQFNQVALALESCRVADLQVVHREDNDCEAELCPAISKVVPGVHEFAKECMQPPMPPVNPSEWRLRDLISSSGPVRIRDDVFGVRIERVSRKVPFGLSFCPAPLLSSKEGNSEGNLTAPMMSWKSTSIGSGEEECQDVEKDSAVASRGSSRSMDLVSDFSSELPTARRESAAPCPPTSLDANHDGDLGLVLGRDMKQHGLLRGDVLLQINGTRAHSSSASQMMRNAMALDLVFQRPVQVGPILSLAEVLEESERRNQVPGPQLWVWSSFVSLLGLFSCVTLPCENSNEADVEIAVASWPRQAEGTRPSGASGVFALMHEGSYASLAAEQAAL